jgi:hypothetical protein
MATNSYGQRLNSFGQPFMGNKVLGVQNKRMMGSAGGGGLNAFHADNQQLANNFVQPFGAIQPEMQETPPPQMQPGWMESLFPGQQQPQQPNPWNPYQEELRLNSFGEPIMGSKIRGVQRRRDLSGNILTR